MAKKRIGAIESAVLDYMKVRQTCKLTDLYAGVQVDTGEGDTKTALAQVRRSANNLVGKGILHHLKLDGRKGYTIDVAHIPKPPEPELPEIAKPPPLPEGAIELLPGLVWSPSDAFGDESLVGVWLGRSPSCLWTSEWLVTFADVQQRFPNAMSQNLNRGQQIGLESYRLSVPELIRICANGADKLNDGQLTRELVDITRGGNDNAGRTNAPNQAAIRYVLNHMNTDNGNLTIKGGEGLRTFLNGERPRYGGPFWSNWSIVTGGAMVSKQVHARGPGWNYAPEDRNLILSGPPKPARRPQTITTHLGMDAGPTDIGGFKGRVVDE